MIGIVINGSPWVEEFRECCIDLDLDFTLVDVSHPDWRSSLRNIDLLLWRYSLSDPQDLNHARIKIPEIELMGIRCYPSSMLTSFYDDKIKQSMMLEANGYPHPKTKIFFSFESVIDDIDDIYFPVVRKLSGGAGSSNVSLINSQKELYKIARKQLSRNIYDRILRYLRYSLGLPSNGMSKDGYLYLQDYIRTENDLRIVTYSQGYFSAFIRMNRKHDFRASGSNIWSQLESERVPIEAVNIAFEITDRFNFKCVAFDFIKSSTGWIIVEFSYGFILNEIYSNTLFRINDGIIKKVNSQRLGVLVLNAIK